MGAVSSSPSMLSLRRANVKLFDETQKSALTALAAGAPPNADDAALLIPFLAQALLDLNQAVTVMLTDLRGEKQPEQER